VNSGCTAATTYATIQAAVNAASSYDVIYVGPGTYHESVTISEADHARDYLSLLGAQAGNDARVGRSNPLAESIVDATGKTDSAIIVEALAVVVDGFTLQGATQGQASGVDLKGTCAASSITPANGGIVVNNILTNNATGISLNAEGYGTEEECPTGEFLVGVLVEHNYIKTNNAGQLAVYPGYGLYSGGAEHAAISQNAFYGHKACGVCLENAEEVTITNNTSLKDASFAQFYATSNVFFIGNQGTNFGGNGTLGDSTGYGDGAVSIALGNQYLVIAENILAGGITPIANGISFTNVLDKEGDINTDVYVKNNTVSGFPQNGIVVEEFEDPAGTLKSSVILGNVVTNNGLDGIFIDGATANGSNRVLDNQAMGNHRFDCHDDTSGAGTDSTANFWFHNIGIYSQPKGLCSSGNGIIR
jgi:hypothetical protein